MLPSPFAASFLESSARNLAILVQEKDGLLEFAPEFPPPEAFASWNFTAMLGDRATFVDHITLLLRGHHQVYQYAQKLISFGGKIVEGPGLFPREFCQGAETIPQDLWLHLVTILMPVGGMVVLIAPRTSGDQLHRYLLDRGTGVHHLAIRVEDILPAAQIWQQKGFIPLSAQPFDDGCLCQWFLRNSAGQILELIYRRQSDLATFSCANITGLRTSEVNLDPTWI